MKIHSKRFQNTEIPSHTVAHAQIETKNDFQVFRLNRIYSWLTFPSLCSTWTCDLQDHPYTKQVESSKQEEWSLSSIRSSVYSVCSFFVYFLLYATIFSWLSLYMFVSEYSIISFFLYIVALQKRFFSSLPWTS